MKKTVAIALLLVLASCGRDDTDTQTHDPELEEFQIILDQSTRMGTSDKTVMETDDNGIIALGYHWKDWRTPKARQNMYVVKMDSKGDIIWDNSFGGEESQYGRCLESANDVYMLLGSAKVGSNSAYRPFLVCIDKNGNKKWSRVYYDLKYESYGVYIIKTSDNNFLITGYIKSGPLTGRPFALKIDDMGERIWYKEYEMARSGMIGGKAIEVNNDFLILAYGLTINRSAIIKIDESGDLIWKKEHEDRKYHSFARAGQEFVCVGQSTSHEVLIAGISIQGDELWNKVYSFGEYWDGEARAVRRDIEGNLVIVGRTDNNKEIEFDTHSEYDDFGLLLAKLDTRGDTLWSKKFQNGNSVTMGMSVHARTDGGYLIGGVSGYTVGHANPMYILSTDADGNIGN